MIENRIRVPKDFEDTKRGGILEAIESHSFEAPFPIRRVFFVRKMTVGSWRGGHVHKSGMQLLFCVRGPITVRIDSQSFVLANGVGVLLCPHERVSYRAEHPDAVLAVLCSLRYDDDELVEE